MVNQAPSPRQTPSWPPSQQSTRITTPVRTNPNPVRPSQDSRKSLSQCNPPSQNPTNQNSEDESGDKDEPQSPGSHLSTQVSQSMNPKRRCKSASSHSTTVKPKAKHQKNVSYVFGFFWVE
ncbi:hypothetical protein Pst134EA_000015 [Puccinia striiformis f. sp. tritici]|uniref:hypothetical protein n=1 Tax=Puccinia striiformis f. sp. tritici TaxID=168172 RepID=UPI0020077C8A|nr:hypothetical protein Pst134EA_000015 [Puccinia striiformis f. sp. tritici]KAH9472929.1 hypothetical protein Pst134EA_000015 [Puccinia striiformis f. sp. tritici]